VAVVVSLLLVVVMPLLLADLVLLRLQLQYSLPHYLAQMYLLLVVLVVVLVSSMVLVVVLFFLHQ
jgi:hypothetical protein